MDLNQVWNKTWSDPGLTPTFYGELTYLDKKDILILNSDKMYWKYA